VDALGFQGAACIIEKPEGIDDGEYGIDGGEYGIDDSIDDGIDDGEYKLLEDGDGSDSGSGSLMS